MSNQLVDRVFDIVNPLKSEFEQVCSEPSLNFKRESEFTDEEQMILKTVVKQAAKYWPRRERLDAAIGYVNTEGGEGINFNQDRTPERDISPATAETLQTITDLLIQLNKTWEEDLLPLCSNLFRRKITEPSVLTEIEAVKALDFLRKKAAA